MKPQSQINLFNELIVDNFAGDGGAFTGIELAAGRPLDIAINHDPGTILMHKTNHPYTKYTLIFDRKMSFAENTMKRIARGNQKFVIDNPEPFIVPIGYGERKGQAPRINSIEQPLNTIVSSCKPISLYACNDRHRATLDDVPAFLN